MDWQIDSGIPNIQNPLYNNSNNRRSVIDHVYSCSSKMEEQRISTGSQRICGRRYGQTQIQKKGQGAILRKKNVTQSKIYQRTSARDWTRKKKKGCDEICPQAFAT